MVQSSGRFVHLDGVNGFVPFFGPGALLLPSPFKGIAMKSLQFLFLASVALLGATANAQAIRFTVPSVTPPVSTLTRAEVTADYHAWRLAGLAALHRGEGTPNTESAAYKQALAKYHALRASSDFPVLVAELAARPHASVRAR
jgi:hypothetical protein